MLAVDRVVRRALERRDEVLAVGDPRRVDRLDVLAVDQPQARVAGRRDHVVLAAAARTHQRHHLVGRAGVLRVHLAARLLLERLHPLRLRVALPRDQVQLSGRRLAGPGRRDGECRSEGGERRHDVLFLIVSSCRRVEGSGSGERVLVAPRDADRRARRSSAAPARRLADGRQALAASLEHDGVADEGADEAGVRDGRRLAAVADRDPLRPDADAASVAHEDVRDADEAGDELRQRALVDLYGRADLLDPARVEDREPVAHRQRLLLVVRDVEERDPELALERLQETASPAGASGRARRAARRAAAPRPVDDRARERDTLPLAARELDRLALGEPSAARSRAPRDPARGARPGRRA